jgi:hypothetical protein
VNFFLDNCLSFRLAIVLNGVFSPDGHQFTALREKFPQNIPDLSWIPRLAAEDLEWTILTTDVRISRSPQELAEWRRSNLTAFFFKSIDRLEAVDQAIRMLQIMPVVIRQATAVRAAQGFMVPARGVRLERLYAPRPDPG